MQCSLVKKKWGKLHKKRDAIELKVYNFLEVIQLSPTHPTTVTKRRSCNLEREELVLFSKLTHIVSSQNLARIFAIWKVRELINRGSLRVLVTIHTVKII